MSDEQQILEEYKLLRTELYQRDKMCLEIMTIVLSVTVLIFIQGFQYKVCWPFFLAIILHLVSYLYILDRRIGIYVLASYITTHIESKLTGLNWETKLKKFRVLYRSQFNRVPGQNVIFIEHFLFNMLILSSAILFSIFSYNIYISIIPCIIWLIFALYSRSQYNKIKVNIFKNDQIGRIWRNIDN